MSAAPKWILSIGNELAVDQIPHRPLLWITPGVNTVPKHRQPPRIPAFRIHRVDHPNPDQRSGWNGHTARLGLLDHYIDRTPGSFLEEMALRLDAKIGELPALAAGFTEELQLGSFCTVFTGTEVLGLIRQGKRPADLARAAYRSVVKRVLEMERVEGRLVATGGVVAHHPMIVELLEKATGAAVTVPEHPQEIGALGVAVAAREAALEAAA